jgi:hypothetical protein
LNRCSFNSKVPPSKQWNDPLKKGNGLIILLESAAEGQPEFTSNEFLNANDLRNNFQKIADSPGKRRIYLVQGQSLDYTSTLGTHLPIHPIFFQEHEQCYDQRASVKPMYEAKNQESVLYSKDSLCLRYGELRQFNRILEDIPYHCSKTGRSIDVMTARSREESTVVFVKRKVSWWGRKTVDGGWNG